MDTKNISRGQLIEGLDKCNKNIYVLSVAGAKASEHIVRITKLNSELVQALRRAKKLLKQGDYHSIRKIDVVLAKCGGDL